jgi:hypothetical protein
LSRASALTLWRRTRLYAPLGIRALAWHFSCELRSRAQIDHDVRRHFDQDAIPI